MTLPTQLRQPGRALIRDRLTQANTAADEAIATYQSLDAALKRRYHNAPSQYEIAKRDDKQIQDAGNRASFYTGQANRLALTLIVDLLTELVGRDG